MCDSCGGNAQNRYFGELAGVVRIATDELSAIFNALLWLVLLELTISYTVIKAGAKLLSLVLVL